MTTSYLFSGDLKNSIGTDAKAVIATIDHNAADGAGNRIPLTDYDNDQTWLPGPARVTVASDLTFSVSLIASNSTGTNVTTGELRWTFTVQYVDASNIRRTTTVSNFEITADLDLSDAVGTADPPATVANAAVAEMEAILAQTETIAGLTGEDAAVAYLIDNASATQTALNASIVSTLAEDGTVVAAAAAAVDGAIYDSRTAKNLYNPDDPDVLTDQAPNLASPGTHLSTANYRTSGFIPVSTALQYTVQNARYYEWYTTGKVSRGAATNTGSNSYTGTLTAPGDGYVRVTHQYVTNPNLQVELGAIATSYEPYFAGTVESIDPQFAAAVGAAIEPYAGALSVTKIGTEVTLTVDLAGSPLALGMDLDGSANGALNLTTATHGGVSVTTPTDDIAPIRTQFGAVGANHGYANVSTFTNPDGKDATDLGSVWQDTAGREYVILGISSTGKPVVGGDYTSPGGIVTSAAVAPVTDLTHVSGATHTAAMAFGTKVAAQLLPSTGRKSVRLLLDGAEVEDGTYHAATVDVVESYDILDYAAIYTAAKANPGVSYSTLDLAGCVRITNRYKWRGTTCRISTVMTELLPTTLINPIGVPIQAVNHSKAGATTTHYLPGVGTVSGFNWTAGVDMTAYASEVTITTAGLSGAQPPAFGMDVLTVSGEPVLGFALGFLPFGVRGDESSRNARRLTNASSGLWRVASFKKSYPAWTLSEPAGWGRLTSEAFRAYLTPTQVAEVLAAKDNALTAWEALGIPT